MHRIDGPGAGTGANNWTEGNPQQGVPATTLTDDYCNDLQEEVCNIIEDNGITLAKGSQRQLKDAIINMIQVGGPTTQFKEDILNAQGSAVDVDGLVFDKSVYKTVVLDVDIERFTDTNKVQETGQIKLNHDTQADAWQISFNSSFGDAGVVFSVTGSGQVQYTSDDLTGANYNGKIRVARTTLFNQ